MPTERELDAFAVNLRLRLEELLGRLPESDPSSMNRTDRAYRRRVERSVKSAVAGKAIFDASGEADAPLTFSEWDHISW